jgi:hypothetical protein
MFGPFVNANSRAQKSRTIVTESLRISIAVAVVAALSLESENAQALEREEPTVPSQWCLSRRDKGPDDPACYQNMVACLLAAFAHGRSCTRRENLTPRTEETLTQRASGTRHHRRRVHSSPQQHPFTTAERDQLYRQFKEWQGRLTD